jgi:hypothetical protein
MLIDQVSEVEVDSTATGTPLPDPYEPAPALSTAKR